MGEQKKECEDKLCSSPRKAEKWREPVPPPHWVHWTIHHCFLRSHFKTQHEDWEYNPIVRELTYYAQNPELNPQHRRNWAWWPIPVIPGLRM